MLASALIRGHMSCSYSSIKLEEESADHGLTTGTMRVDDLSQHLRSAKCLSRNCHSPCKVQALQSTLTSSPRFLLEDKEEGAQGDRQHCLCR